MSKRPLDDPLLLTSSLEATPSVGSNKRPKKTHDDTRDHIFEAVWSALDRNAFYGPPLSEPLSDFRPIDWEHLIERGYTWEILAQHIENRRVNRVVDIGPLVLTTGRKYGYHVHLFSCDMMRICCKDLPESGSDGMQLLVDHLRNLLKMIMCSKSDNRMSIVSELFWRVLCETSATFHELDISNANVALDEASSARLLRHSSVCVSNVNLKDGGTTFLARMLDDKSTKIQSLKVIFKQEDVTFNFDFFNRVIKSSTSLKCLCVQAKSGSISSAAWHGLVDAIGQSKSLVEVGCIQTGPTPDYWLGLLLVLLRSTTIHTTRFSLGDDNFAEHIRRANSATVLNAVKENRVLTSFFLPQSYITLQTLYFHIEIVLRINKMRMLVEPIVKKAAGNRNAALLGRLIARRKVRKSPDMIFEILLMSNHLLKSKVDSLSRPANKD